MWQRVNLVFFKYFIFDLVASNNHLQLSFSLLVVMRSILATSIVTSLVLALSTTDLVEGQFKAPFLNRLHRRKVQFLKGHLSQQSWNGLQEALHADFSLADVLHYPLRLSGTLGVFEGPFMCCARPCTVPDWFLQNNFVIQLNNGFNI